MILTCAFGLPWDGHWSQPCLWCQTESDRLAAEYAAQGDRGLRVVKGKT